MPADEQSKDRENTAPASTPQGSGRNSAGQQRPGTGSRRPNAAGGSTPGGAPDDDRNRRVRRQVWSIVVYVVVALIALYLFQQLILGPMGPSTELPYSEFKTKLAAGQILTAEIGDQRISGTMKSTKPDSAEPMGFTTNADVAADDQLVQQLQAA